MRVANLMYQRQSKQGVVAALGLGQATHYLLHSTRNFISPIYPNECVLRG
jgi:hypothetical protein